MLFRIVEQNCYVHFVTYTLGSDQSPLSGAGEKSSEAAFGNLIPVSELVHVPAPSGPAGAVLPAWCVGGCACASSEKLFPPGTCLSPFCLPSVSDVSNGSRLGHFDRKRRRPRTGWSLTGIHVDWRLACLVSSFVLEITCFIPSRLPDPTPLPIIDRSITLMQSFPNPSTGSLLSCLYCCSSSLMYMNPPRPACR